jgi:hypothetical protein
MQSALLPPPRSPEGISGKWVRSEAWILMLVLSEPVRQGRGWPRVHCTPATQAPHIAWNARNRFFSDRFKRRNGRGGAQKRDAGSHSGTAYIDPTLLLTFLLGGPEGPNECSKLVGLFPTLAVGPGAAPRTREGRCGVEGESPDYF